MKIDFFIAGAQKGGTSSLHSYLSEHASLCMSRPKEIHFFDNEDHDWTALNDTAIADYFSHSQDGQLWGESTPIYLFWPPSIPRIKRHNPDAKLLFLLRDPVERAHSHWRMQVARNVDQMSFSSAIREGRARITNALDSARRQFSYVERGFYAKQIGRALQFFPLEQMLFLRSEDLLSDPAAALNRICDFLAIPHFQTTPSQRQYRPFNPPLSSPMEQPDRLHLEGIYDDDLASLWDLTRITWTRL